MPTYKCNTCNYIQDFKEKYEYELKTKTCGRCNKVGTFRAYSGPMTDAILDKEDERKVKLKNDLGVLDGKIDALTKNLEKIQGDKKSRQQDYERIKTPTEAELKTYTAEIEKFNEAMIEVAGQLEEQKKKWKVMVDQFDDLGNRQAVRKDAVVAHDAASVVEQTSGKNKLYIGSRQYVSSYVSGAKSKKLRILDVPNWSPGLNVSWVEGGIKAKAHFKIKLDQENEYHSIPEAVLQKFKEDPAMEPDEFYKICKEDGKGSVLWYDKDGRNRPTWTAMEIWCLLRAGYTFTFATSSKDASGQKIVLMPPAQ